MKDLFFYPPAPDLRELLCGAFLYCMCMHTQKPVCNNRYWKSRVPDMIWVAYRCVRDHFTSTVVLPSSLSHLCGPLGDQEVTVEPTRSAMHRKTQESLLWKWKHAYLTCPFVSPKIPGYNYSVVGQLHKIATFHTTIWYLLVDWGKGWGLEKGDGPCKRVKKKE